MRGIAPVIEAGPVRKDIFTPGGWQFVREPDWGTYPAKASRLLVLQTLEEKVDGPWEFYVDIPTNNLIPGQADPIPTPAP